MGLLSSDCHTICYLEIKQLNINVNLKMTSALTKVLLLGLTPCISDKIGIFNIVQIILQLGQLTHLFSSKALLGKDINGKEYI